jgi:hypothetical protein
MNIRHVNHAEVRDRSRSGVRVRPRRPSTDVAPPASPRRVEGGLGRAERRHRRTVLVATAIAVVLSALVAAAISVVLGRLLVL